MKKDLEELLDRAAGIRMSDADKEAQRQSFAYGNANIENGKVTKEMVAAAAERIRR